MEPIHPKIDPGWLSVLSDEFNKPYFQNLKKFLVEEKEKHQVYPPGQLIFNAFDTTPFDKVRVVILGQDPYHGPGQAHGLCFSVPDGVRFPPSLLNIFKEIKADTGGDIPQTGNLSRWAQQGVLLLNATLTVRANQAGSHQGKGWETFTDTVISKISQNRSNVVFILWGRFAQQKASMIDTRKHMVLKAAHPSPLSAYNGFFGCHHFSATNKYLVENGLNPIEW